MTRVRDVYKAIDSFAPFSHTEDWDKCGLQAGDASAKVKLCIIALDLTHEVINEAKEKGAGLIITHHPIFFDESDEMISKALGHELSFSGIAHISVHTNLDNAAGGVDDTLADVLGLTDIIPLQTEVNQNGISIRTGRIGALGKSYTPDEFAQYVKQRLNCVFVHFVQGTRIITRVATCAGAGSSFLCNATEKGADAFITGDVKHSAMVGAENSGITLVDAGHFATESIIAEPLRCKLSQLCSGCEFIVAESMKNPVNII